MDPSVTCGWQHLHGFYNKCQKTFVWVPQTIVSNRTCFSLSIDLDLILELVQKCKLTYKGIVLLFSLCSGGGMMRERHEKDLYSCHPTLLDHD